MFVAGSCVDALRKPYTSNKNHCNQKNEEQQLNRPNIGMQGHLTFLVLCCRAAATTSCCDKRTCCPVTRSFFVLSYPEPTRGGRFVDAFHQKQEKNLSLELAAFLVFGF